MEAAILLEIARSFRVLLASRKRRSLESESCLNQCANEAGQYNPDQFHDSRKRLIKPAKKGKKLTPSPVPNEHCFVLRETPGLSSKEICGSFD
jgi:hypothetical protein